jgi:hypothetical protein
VRARDQRAEQVVASRKILSEIKPMNAPKRPGLFVADVVVLLFNILGVLVLALESASLSRLEKLFRGLVLPAPTAWMFHAKVPLVLLGGVAVILGIGIVLRARRISEASTLFIVAAIVANIGAALCFVALFLPNLRALLMPSPGALGP